MTFAEISTDILERLGLTSPEDMARISRAINRRYREITSSLGIRHVARRITAQEAMTAGVSTLTFTNAEKVVAVYNRNVSPYKELEEVTIDELRRRQPFGASDAPTQYAIQSIGSDSVTILVDCTPQTALVLYADVQSTAITLSCTDEPAFSESYHDILISAVLIDEYMKLEKPSLSRVEAVRVYGDGSPNSNGRMGELRHWLAVSTTKKQYFGKQTQAGMSGVSGGGGSGGGTDGSSSYTQNGLITFDRSSAGPTADAPFAVISGANVVANLDADKLDGLDSTDFRLAATAIGETDFTFTDITTANVSSTKHGLAPKSPADATKFLNGAATPAYALVKDSDLSTSDVTTNDVTTAKHGFAPKAPNDTTKFLRGDASWAVPVVPVVPIRIYTPTLADITNTVTTTTFLSFTVGANEMADGDVIEISFAVLLKNNRGGVSSLEIDAFWGATNVRSTDGAAGFAWSNNATERKWMYRYMMARVGTDLWIFGPQTTTPLSMDQINGNNPTGYAGAVTMTPTFSSSATVALKGTFSNADATTYWKVQSAKVRKIS